MSAIAVAEQLRQEVHQAVLQLPNNNAAYIQASQKCPHLIRNETDPLLYLKFGNVAEAAVRLALLWEKRVQAFSKRAFLPMSFLDGVHGALNPQDVELLRTEYVCFLPGALQEHNVILYDYMRGSASHGREDRMARYRIVLFLFTQIVTAGQGRPFVALRLSDNPQYDKVKTERLFETFSAFPFELKAWINLFLAPAPGAKRLFESTVAKCYVHDLGKSIGDVVTNLVCENKQELLSKLTQLGLAQQGLPESVGGTWSYEHFHAWLESLGAPPRQVDQKPAAVPLPPVRRGPLKKRPRVFHQEESAQAASSLIALTNAACAETRKEENAAAPHAAARVECPREETAAPAQEEENAGPKTNDATRPPPPLTDQDVEPMATKRRKRETLTKEERLARRKAKKRLIDIEYARKRRQREKDLVASLQRDCIRLEQDQVALAREERRLTQLVQLAEATARGGAQEAGGDEESTHIDCPVAAATCADDEKTLEAPVQVQQVVDSEEKLARKAPPAETADDKLPVQAVAPIENQLPRRQNSIPRQRELPNGEDNYNKPDVEAASRSETVSNLAVQERKFKAEGAAAPAAGVAGSSSMGDGIESSSSSSVASYMAAANPMVQCDLLQQARGRGLAAFLRAATHSLGHSNHLLLPQSRQELLLDSLLLQEQRLSATESGASVHFNSLR